MKPNVPRYSLELQAALEAKLPNGLAVPIPDAKPRTTFYPSDMGACPRKVYYHLSNTPPDPDYVKKDYPLGNLYSARVIDKLRAAGFAVIAEFPVTWADASRHVVINGYVDALIWWGGMWVPVEIKSVESDWQVKQKCEEGDEIHQTQLQCYLHMLPKEWPIPSHGFLIYVSRGSELTRAVEVDYSASSWNRIIQTAWSVYVAKEQKQAPSRPWKSNAENWQCGYCPFKTQCWGASR